MDRLEIIFEGTRMRDRDYLQSVLNRRLTHYSKRVEFLEGDPRGWYLVDGNFRRYIGLTILEAHQFILQGFYV